MAAAAKAYAAGWREPSQPLCIPAIAAGIPGRFSIHAKSDALTATALDLANLGVLQDGHWNGNVREAVTEAFRDMSYKLVPNPLAEYTLLVVEDTVAADLEYDSSHGYHIEHNLPVSKDKRVRSPKISALVLTFNNEAIVHRVIGPAIKRLEKKRPGLGQSVFYWLHTAFSESVRAVDPVDGYGWAQMNYWGGEMDESMRLEDEMDFMRSDHEQKQAKLPKAQRTEFDEAAAIKAIGIFSLADYNQTIPPEFGSKFSHRPKLTLNQLTRHVRPELANAIKVVAGLLKERKHKSEINDVGHFEKCRWEMSPYLLRWHCTDDRKSQDPLAQIYDDYMNDAMQSGEDMLDVNAVFAWHDAETLASAVQRFESYCRLLHAAENLLRLIAPQDT